MVAVVERLFRSLIREEYDIKFFRGLVQRQRDAAQAGQSIARAEEALQAADRLERDAGPDRDRAAQAGAASEHLRAAQALGFGDTALLNLRRAQALLHLGRAEEALEPVYAAASARPYDVDSRVVHGAVRLALGNLMEAEHEYASVLEEFSGDPDALAGLRAVALARGELRDEEYLPSDEQVRAEDLATAARCLIAAWTASGSVVRRLDALVVGGAGETVLALLRRERARRAAGGQRG